MYSLYNHLRKLECFVNVSAPLEKLLTRLVHTVLCKIEILLGNESVPLIYSSRLLISPYPTI